MGKDETVAGPIHPDQLNATRLRGLGFEIVGFSLRGPQPVGLVHMPVARGLTALYGRNGAGKSATLRGIAAALSGVRATNSGVEIAVLHIRMEYDDDSLDGCSLACHLAKVLASRIRRYRPFLRSHDRREIDELLGDPNEYRSENEDELLPGSALPHLSRLLLTAAVEANSKNPDQWTQLIDQVADGGYFSLRAGRNVRPTWTVYLSGLRSGGKTQLDEAYLSAHSSGVKALRAALGLDTDQDLPAGSGYPFDCEDGPLSATEDAFIAASPGHYRILEPKPLWVPVEAAYAGDLAFAPVEVHQPADEPAELDGRTLDWLLSPAPYRDGEKPERVLVATDNDEVEIDSRVSDALKLVSERSSRLLSTLLPDAPELQCQLEHPDKWLASLGLGWRALDRPSGCWVPLAAISKSERRWASVAIGLMLRKRNDEIPSVVLFDEPEAALHRSAEVRLVGALVDMSRDDAVADAVVVATHSPSFVNHPEVTKIHVRRDALGLAEAASLQIPLGDELGRELAAESLGLRLADLLQLLRVLVLVEGCCPTR